MHIRSIVLAAAFVISVWPPLFAGEKTAPHYELAVVLNPEKKSIEVTGSLRLGDGAAFESFAFYLHKGLAVRSLSIDGTPVDLGTAAPSDIRFMPAAAGYTAKLPAKNGIFPNRLIAFSYAGVLDERPEWLANIMSENWVEIGNYLPWFPVCPDIGPFTYVVTVAAPPRYRVFAPGKETRAGDRFVFDYGQPTSDIVICAATDLEVRAGRVDGNDIRLVSSSLDSKTAEALIRDAEDINRLLGRWYGHLEGSLSLVESKREKGGGYSRPGGLFLAGFSQTPYLSNRLGYRRYLAHEIAHGWWKLADASTWHDWLNESFAEFSALLYLRETAGPEEFRSRLAAYAREGKNLPPLWALDRNHESAYQALYRKGPVLLQRLEERLGTERFFALCRTILGNHIGQTEDFLEALAAVDAETAVWFENMLKTPGRPESEDPMFGSVIARFRESIPKRMAEKKVPGAAVAVVTDSSILWQEGFGTTAESGGVPVTAETPFSIQSMSKIFTAAAVLAAVRDGLVSLDEPITSYLPGFTVNSRFETHPERRMTLRLLLSHRAGFTHEAPDGGNYDPGSGSFEAHIRSISKTWLRFPVDQRYCYSNLGVDLAGYILQVRSGRPFAEYVRRTILSPAGMKTATFDIEIVKKNPRRAVGHAMFRQPVPVEIPMIPAGGLYSSAADLAAYVRFHLNGGKGTSGPGLPPGLLAEMSRIPGRNPRQINGYGLGLAITPYAGTILHTHSGGGFGFLSYMAWLPELKIGVVCLTNAVGHNLNTAIGAELLERFIAAGASAKPLPPAGEVSLRDLPPEFPVSPSEQARLAGQYLYASGGWMNIEYRDGRIGVSSGGEFRPGRMVTPDEVVFVTGGIPFFYRFIRDEAGAPVRLIRQYDGETLDIHSGLEDPPGPDRPEWDAYAGDYSYKVNGLRGGMFKVGKRNGWLYLDHFKLVEYHPGLFFAAHGEVLDLTGPFPSWRNIRLEKQAPDSR